MHSTADARSRPRHDEAAGREPLSLHDRAMDNLRFIRETMERAGSFTAVPGWGIAVTGLAALGAAAVAALQPTSLRWLGVWLVAAAVAVVVVLTAARRKAAAAGTPLTTQPTRRFLLSFAPPLLAGALLTPVLFGAGLVDRLPGAWLLLYGTGVVTGGAFSVRTVPLLGLSLMGAGAVALGFPSLPRDAVMAVGFGALHIFFGILIARRHGG